MQLDCDTCPGHPHACHGCVMTVLIAAPTTANTAGEFPLPSDEADIETRRLHAAVAEFVAAGMVPCSAHDVPVVRRSRGQRADDPDNVLRLRAS